MGEPNPWILATIANEGLQHGIFIGNESSPHHPSAGNERSNMDIAIRVITGFLPIVTICLGVVLKYLLNYVLNHVIFTLATVETPIPGRVESEKIGSEKYGILSEAEEKAAFQSKPHYTTSSIRATIRHLSQEAGDLSMFRGLGADLALICIIMPLGIAMEFLAHTVFTDIRWSSALVELVMPLLFAQAHTTCIHIVISKPRQKFWFRRFGVSWFGAIRTLFIAIAAQGLLRIGFDWIFTLISDWSSPKSLPQFQYYGDGPATPLSITMISMILIKWFVRAQIKPLIKLLITVPLNTIRSRIQASMLPDTDDPIIPMDRSFQGRPQSGGILQQQPQPLSFMQSFRTLNKRTYLRILRLDIKIHLIQELAFCAFMTLLFAQVVWFVGPSAVWVVLKMVMGTPIVQSDLDSVVGNTTRSILDKVVEGMVQLNTTQIDERTAQANADIRALIDSFNTTRSTTMVA